MSQTRSSVGSTDYFVQVLRRIINDNPGSSSQQVWYILCADYCQHVLTNTYRIFERPSATGYQYKSIAAMYGVRANQKAIEIEASDLLEPINELFTFDDLQPGPFRNMLRVFLNSYPHYVSYLNVNIVKTLDLSAPYYPFQKDVVDQVVTKWKQYLDQNHAPDMLVETVIALPLAQRQEIVADSLKKLNENAKEMLSLVNQLNGKNPYWEEKPLRSQYDNEEKRESFLIGNVSRIVAILSTDQQREFALVVRTIGEQKRYRERVYHIDAFKQIIKHTSDNILQIELFDRLLDIIQTNKTGQIVAVDTILEIINRFSGLKQQQASKVLTESLLPGLTGKPGLGPEHAAKVLCKLTPLMQSEHRFTTLIIVVEHLRTTAIQAQTALVVKMVSYLSASQLQDMMVHVQKNKLYLALSVLLPIYSNEAHCQDIVKELLPQLSDPTDEIKRTAIITIQNMMIRIQDETLKQNVCHSLIAELAKKPKPNDDYLDDKIDIVNSLTLIVPTISDEARRQMILRQIIKINFSPRPFNCKKYDTCARILETLSPVNQQHMLSEMKLSEVDKNTSENYSYEYRKELIKILSKIMHTIHDRATQQEYIAIFHNKLFHDEHYYVKSAAAHALYQSVSYIQEEKQQQQLVGDLVSALSDEHSYMFSEDVMNTLAVLTPKLPDEFQPVTIKSIISVISVSYSEGYNYKNKRAQACNALKMYLHQISPEQQKTLFELTFTLLINEMEKSPNDYQLISMINDILDAGLQYADERVRRYLYCEVIQQNFFAMDPSARTSSVLSEPLMVLGARSHAEEKKHMEIQQVTSLPDGVVNIIRDYLVVSPSMTCQ